VVEWMGMVVVVLAVLVMSSSRLELVLRSRRARSSVLAPPSLGVQLCSSLHKRVSFNGLHFFCSVLGLLINAVKQSQ
jgi:hypothetical protein